MQNNIKQIIGKRVKELRDNLKLSQEALADKAELDRTFINHVENGRRNISIDNIQKIVQALEVSISDFFNTNDFKAI
ncbi:MAG: helix-turn-helix transcriptional regulator [Bacteroidetes bacterium]|nr:helix-turn-helix transcriptional regulator [Bacteroidota bacterium]